MKKAPQGFTTMTVNLRNDNIRIIRKKRHTGLTSTDYINQALDNYFTFNLTLYIIVHRISNRFHIGFYEGEEPHGPHWHYIYSTGSDTVGDAIRKERPGRFKLETIGRFSSLEHLTRTFRFYHRLMSKKARPYESFRDDDNVELLLKNYSKSIGKNHAKKETKKV